MRHITFVGLLALVVQIYATTDYNCHESVEQHCSSKPPGGNFYNCSAMFSGAHTVMDDFQDYVLQHLLNSYQYLLMSANFGNYERQREGFAKLFKKLSDDTWDDAVDIIKYMTKRGGSFNFQAPLMQSVSSRTVSPLALEMTEPESLSLALDMYKHLAHKAHQIHGQVTKRSHNNQEIHDADVLSFIENKFVSKHTDIIRDLSGHSNDLMNLIRTAKKDKKDKFVPNQAGLSIYLFDDYLKSVY